MEQKLLNCLNEYYEREFEYTVDSLPENGVIPIASTTHEFFGEEHDISIEFDMNESEYRNYLDGELILTEYRENLDDVAHELLVCSFDDMLHDCIFDALELLTMEALYAED